MQARTGSGMSTPSWQRLRSIATSKVTPKIGKPSTKTVYGVKKQDNAKEQTLIPAISLYSSTSCLSLRSFFSNLLFSFSTFLSPFLSFSFALTGSSFSLSLDFSRFSLDLDVNLKDFDFFAFEGLLQ